MENKPIKRRRKAVLLAVAAVAAALVLCVGGYLLFRNRAEPPADADSSQSQTRDAAGDETYIGREEALNLACAHAGVAAGDVLRSEVELDSDDGVMIYQVEFQTGTNKYAYDIDALTGEVLKAEMKAPDTQDTVSSGGEDAQATVSSGGEDAQAAVSSGGEKDSASYIGEDTALAVALSHAMVDASSVTKKSVELDEENRRMIYDVEFEVGQEEYQYQIDATNGRVLKVEHQTPDIDNG